MPANQAQNESKILELALMDFMRLPAEEIRKRLDVVQSTVYSLRQTDLYKSTTKDLIEERKKQMLSLPDTNELKRELSHAATLTIKGLVQILSSEKTSNKDFIAAGRLALQADGRFIGEERSEEVKHEDTEQVAAELRGAFDRLNKSIQ